MSYRPSQRQFLPYFIGVRCLFESRDDRTKPKSLISLISGWLVLVARSFCLSLLLAVLCQKSSAEEETPTLPAASDRVGETNFQEVLQAIMQLQMQISSNEVAFEQRQKDAKDAASASAQALARGMQDMENAISAQQEAMAARSVRELEAMQSSNNLMLGFAGTFAGIAFLTLIVTAYFQWRMGKAWTRISTALRVSQPLDGGAMNGVAALSSSVDESNQRLLGTVEQLKRQAQVLEDASKTALKLYAPDPRSQENGTSPARTATRSANGNSKETSSNGDDRVPALLRQGQTLLRENNLEAALKCFDEILALDPNHGEALVRKGATLERLKKLTEAFECYDRAIAADDSMTLAYLYKGGLCNRLERFKEALECYDKALQTQVE